MLVFAKPLGRRTFVFDEVSKVPFALGAVLREIPVVVNAATFGLDHYLPILIAMR